MENHNGLNGSLFCPAISSVNLRPNETLETGDLFNSQNRSSYFWLTSSQGRIFIFHPNSNFQSVEDKKPLTKKMSFNAFRQTNSKFDFTKTEGNAERIFHVMSKEKGTAKIFKTIKINNDFLRFSKPKDSSQHKSQKSNEPQSLERNEGLIPDVKLDYKNLNGQKVLYEEHSELKFPWTLKSSFKATAVRPEIIRTFSQEKVV